MSGDQSGLESRRQRRPDQVTAEHHQLVECIARLQRNECCVRRAVSLMVFLVSLAMVGLGYSVILQADQLELVFQLAAPLINRVFCVLGLGAMICLVWFVGLGLANRRELDQRREECCRSAAKLLESRPSNPVTSPWDSRNTPDRQENDGATRVVEAGNRSPAVTKSTVQA